MKIEEKDETDDTDDSEMLTLRSEHFTGTKHLCHAFNWSRKMKK